VFKRDSSHRVVLSRTRHDRSFSLFDASFSRRGTSNSRGRSSLVSVPRIAAVFLLHLLLDRSATLSSASSRRLFFPPRREDVFCMNGSPPRGSRNEWVCLLYKMQPVSRYLTSFDFVDDIYIFLNASKIFINYDINRLFNTLILFGEILSLQFLII